MPQAMNRYFAQFGMPPDETAKLRIEKGAVIVMSCCGSKHHIGLLLRAAHNLFQLILFFFVLLEHLHGLLVNRNLAEAHGRFGC